LLADLLSESGSDVVLTMTEVTSEETRVDSQVRNALSGKAKLESLWGHTLYHPDDLPFDNDLSDMQDVFTPFKNKVESKSSVRALLKTPQKGDLPTPKSGVEATPAAEWDKLPLADSVKAGGLPETQEHSVLDFQVCICACICHSVHADSCEYMHAIHIVSNSPETLQTQVSPTLRIVSWSAGW
jgi:deoxyribodipyrimidine photo-lyase